MSERELIERFASLFAGRTDAWGHEEGRCIHEEVDFYNYKDHLFGRQPLGIYPLRPDSTVKWGCLDIDTDDLQAAINFYEILESVDIPIWVEVSRSKGFHAWCFVEEFIPAWIMRRALLVARDFIGLSDVKEVNPKREDGSESLSNYVRLPYPGAMRGASYAWGARRVMLDPHLRFQANLSFLGFLSGVSFAPVDKLELLASRWKEPKRTPTPFNPPASIHEDGAHLQAKRALHDLNIPLLWHIVKDGPVAGGDRSSTLMRIANMAAMNGAKPEDCAAILFYADSQPWGGKYVDRPEYYFRIVEQVYSTLDPRELANSRTQAYP